MNIAQKIAVRYLGTMDNPISCESVERTKEGQGSVLEISPKYRNETLINVTTVRTVSCMSLVAIIVFSSLLSDPLAKEKTSCRK
jgi:hypothetical protein